MPNHTSRQPSPRMLLRQQMAQVFSESELRTLCFDLEIDFEELGQGNKTDRIISLIRLMQRQGRLADLRDAVVDARPHLAWPTLEALESSKDEEWHGTEPTPRKLTREEQQAQRNRQTMLAKVKAYWVDGVLAHSLHSKVIPLDMERKPDAVTRPRDMLWQVKDQQPQPLPPGTRIIDRLQYTAGEALLILGEPGSGKTTMLLELAGELLAWAEQNETLRIPVVFNLSSWAIKRPPLTEWLISELQSSLYRIPEKTARIWVEQDDILPLLDGLDEVAEAHRIACIQAINTYHAQHGLTPIVICSRTADYKAIGPKLHLSNALLLRSLTPDQIDDYLSSGGHALDTIRQVIQQDTVLQEMAQSPLLLSIMALTYHDHPPEQFTRTNPEEHRRQLFATYLQHQLPKRPKGPAEDIDITRCQLTYLAHQMTAFDQTIFLIERIQPNWLPVLKQQRLYYQTVGIVTGLIAMLTVGLAVGLAFGLPAGLIIGLASALILGLVIGRLAKRIDIVPVETVRWSWKSSSRKLWVRSLVVRMGVCVVVGELVGLIGIRQDVGLDLKILVGTVLGIYFALILGLGWSLFDKLLDLLIDGLVSGQIETKTTPNEGIKRSAQNAVRVGLFFGIVLGIVLALGSGFMFWFTDNLVFGVGFGVVAGSQLGWFGGLIRGGGIAVVQHYSLRFYLHRYGYLPWKLVPFLDLAAERLILQKIGGGYRFVHRLLQEYLASLYIDEGGGK